MRAFEVQHIDGAYHVRLDLGPQPIILGHAPLGALDPGWKPEWLFEVNETLNILALGHEDGRRAAWFLDGGLRFLTNSGGQLPPDQRTQIANAGIPVIRALCGNALLWEPEQTPDSAFEAVFAAVLASDPAIILPIAEAVCPPSRSVVLYEQNGRLDPRAIEQLPEIFGGPIDMDALQSFFQQDILAGQIEAARTGRLMMRSPLDGHQLISDAAWCPQPDGLIYRFNGPEPRDQFFAILYGFQISLFSVYFPRYNLFLYAGKAKQDRVHRALTPRPERGLFDHILRFADHLPKPGTDFRQPLILRSYDHLGHHLWNELGGLYDTVKALGADHMPPVIIANPEMTEMYGDIDTIFPELDGKVYRVNNLHTAIDATYHGGFLPLRPTGVHVCRDLASRIGRIAAGKYLNSATIRLLEGLRAARFRFVILGLRVENRTVVDFPTFCEDLITMLTHELGRVLIIVDGQNSSDTGQDYRVTLMEPGRDSPLKIETSIVERLERHFASNRDVVILSAIGLPILASIALCAQAEFFVTPWGAGLAKYRWICDRPGLALAGPACERTQPIHLYDDPRFTEAASPMYFMGPGEIEDAPDDPVLLPGGDADRVNIRVDMAALRTRIRTMIAALPGMD